MRRLKRSDRNAYHGNRFRDEGAFRTMTFLQRLLCLAALAAALLPLPARATEVDPKIACRAEEIITALAGAAPDKLDFFGERKGKGSYRCEAYFSYKVYADVWTRINALMPTLRKVEAACAARALTRLPRVGALQLQYDITTSGKYRITAAGDLPTDPQKLSRTLRTQIAELAKIRDADDDILYASFARKNCPLAEYPDIE